MPDPNMTLFTSTLLLSTLSVTSTNSWISMWMMLEINMMSFIPLISLKNSMNSTETSIKYFLIQALSSSILLLLIMNFHNLPLTNFMILMPIMMKLGTPPLHFWFTNIMEGISWMNCLILMTWQKIAPISIMSFYSIKSMIILFSLSTIITGSIGGLNQTSIRKIMTFSSINNLGWMMITITMNEQIWLKYMIMYTILTTSITILMKKNMFNIKQIYLKLNPLLSLTFSFNILSMSGLPPLMGFLPKWMSIQLIASMNLLLPAVIMIMFSLPTMMFYLNIIYNNLTMFSLSNPWKLMYKSNPLITLSTMIIMGLPLMTPLWV